MQVTGSKCHKEPLLLRIWWRRIINTEATSELIPAEYFQQEAYLECLLILYKQTPMAVAGHLIAGGFLFFALSPVVPLANLIFWWLTLAVIGAARAVLTILYIRAQPISERHLNNWILPLNLFAFLQTLNWGMAVFVIWPDSVEYRAVLVATLAGVIAAGGVILSVHRQSFVVYCLPIAIPATAQLLLSGGRVEWVLGTLVVLYSILLIVAVSRLGNSFLEGMILRLQMQALSRTDALTNLANRRGFDEYLGDSWQNAMRGSQSIGLILADIDFFKRYNDTYGHPKGDTALSQVAGVLRRVASRGTDLCARIGGEEFAIVLPSTDAEGTLRVANEIKSALAEARISHEASPLGQLTISMGVISGVPNRNSDLTTFFSEADKALYRAKEKGRDRIEVKAPASPPPSPQSAPPSPIAG